MPLHLVSTPIGNLGDLSERALATLRAAAVVAAEDTRRTGLLLSRFNITARLVSFHDHNEEARARELLPLLKDGLSVAVVSDAGTPGIADPSYRLVRLAIDNDIPVVPIPGPCACIVALSASGLPTDRFTFEGFLPVKSGRRKTRLTEWLTEERTVIFYESPHRILRTLLEMQAVLGDIHAVVARELTKIHETFYRGPLSEIHTRLEKEGPRGEFTVLFNRKGAAATPPETLDPSFFPSDENDA